MAINGVMRIGDVQIRVLDLEKAVHHYDKIMGLHETYRDNRGRVFFKCWDEFDHHSIILREADKPGIDFAGYKVLNDETLTAIEKKLTAGGVKVEQIPAGGHPKCGRRIGFQIPTGHTIQLYAEKEWVGNGIPMHNPEVIPEEGVVRGMGAWRLEHVLLYGPGIADSAKFFEKYLDFKLSEQVVDDDSKKQVAAFLTCGNKAHDIAFVEHPEPNKLHHVSFWLDNFIEVQHAGDLIGRNGVSLDIGPTRHGITRGATIYFYDPSGNRNEVFSGGYVYYPDRPPLTWDASNLGKAIFYVDQKINAAFMTVVT